MSYVFTANQLMDHSLGTMLLEISKYCYGGYLQGKRFRIIIAFCNSAEYFLEWDGSSCSLYNIERNVEKYIENFSFKNVSSLSKRR